MSVLRAHFESRAAELSDRASLEVVEKDGAVTLAIRPHAPRAAGVVLFLAPWGGGSVSLDDRACVPAELGDDAAGDLAAIDHFIRVAVDGRATAFHVGRGGCVEVRQEDKVSRGWHNAWPWPGWRWRAVSVQYEPY